MFYSGIFLLQTKKLLFVDKVIITVCMVLRTRLVRGRLSTARRCEYNTDKRLVLPFCLTCVICAKIKTKGVFIMKTQTSIIHYLYYGGILCQTNLIQNQESIN